MLTDNADPFAPAVWRSPVHRTPEWIIWLAQLVRLLYQVVRFVVRHPLLDVDRAPEIRIGQDVAVAETEEDGGVAHPDHREPRSGIVERKAMDGRLEPVRRAAEREGKESGDLLDTKHAGAKIKRR